MQLRHLLPVFFVTAFFFSFASSSSSFSQSQNGKYSGPVQAEWLDNDGRSMRLLSDFWYEDPGGVRWEAPKDSVVDGASIPQFGWTFIGGPFTGRYRNASVIHDVACDEKKRRWEDVHEAFYYAMLTSGVAEWKAKVMYGAVYWKGPRWPHEITISERFEETILADDKIASIKKQVTENLATRSADGTNYIETSRTIIPPRIRFNGLKIRRTPGRVIIKMASVPPSQELSENELKILQSQIESRAASATGGMTLEEIRNFKPNN